MTDGEQPASYSAALANGPLQLIHTALAEPRTIGDIQPWASVKAVDPKATWVEDPLEQIQEKFVAVESVAPTTRLVRVSVQPAGFVVDQDDVRATVGRATPTVQPLRSGSVSPFDLHQPIVDFSGGRPAKWPVGHEPHHAVAPVEDPSAGARLVMLRPACSMPTRPGA